MHWLPFPQRGYQDLRRAVQEYGLNASQPVGFPIVTPKFASITGGNKTRSLTLMHARTLIKPLNNTYWTWTHLGRAIANAILEISEMRNLNYLDYRDIPGIDLDDLLAFMPERMRNHLLTLPWETEDRWIKPLLDLQVIRRRSQHRKTYDWCYSVKETVVEFYKTHPHLIPPINILKKGTRRPSDAKSLDEFLTAIQACRPESDWDII